jgi:hypothetical protein
MHHFGISSDTRFIRASNLLGEFLQSLPTRNSGAGGLPVDNNRSNNNSDSDKGVSPQHSHATITSFIADKPDCIIDTDE